VICYNAICCLFVGAHLPLGQPPAGPASYQQLPQPRQQHQLYTEPHYATPRPSHYQAPPADQRDAQYGAQQPVYRQLEKPRQEQPQRMELRSHPQQQSSWQQPHPTYDRNQYGQQQQPNYQHQQPSYHQQQPRREPQYQPTYAAPTRHQYEPQYQQQALYNQPQYGRVPSAFEPSYADPRIMQDGRVVSGRSKSASDLNHPEAMGAWPTQPSLQHSHGHQPLSSTQEPLSSWKSYEAPGQRGLAAGVDMQEPVKVDRRRGESTYEGRQVIPDARQYGEPLSAPPTNRQGPYWQESDHRSQPQLNVSRQQPPATFSSHPELSAAHQLREPTPQGDAAPFTSNDLLRRAQPSQRSPTTPTPFTQQAPAFASTGQGPAERRSIPVGGHLRAIDPKNVSHMTPVMPPNVSEHQRPQTYYKPPSQGSAAADESAHVRPNDRSQPVPRAVRLPSGAWERARKEEELKDIELEQKRRREEEIRQLESRLPDQLSPAEMDRLRRLKLSAEFDRRAVELERSGDQSADTHTDMTAAVSAVSLMFTCDISVWSLYDL